MRFESFRQKPVLVLACALEQQAAVKTGGDLRAMPGDGMTRMVLGYAHGRN
jgi:hypothetical protein